MKSSLYRELSQEELERIVEESLHTRFVSAKLLTGGLFNTTYLVQTQKLGRVVLRLGPVNRHLLMPFEHHLMEAERQVYDLCSEHGIAVCDILAMDVTKTRIDRDFMFVRYIPGRAMYGVEIRPEARENIMHTIGRETAKMHGIQAKQFGRIVDVAKGQGFSLWSECLLHELCQWENVGVPASLFTKEEHDKIRWIFRAASSFLDEIKEPRLIHADLWLGNILVSEDDQTPEFMAIIDADRALWGDAEFEFSAIQWTHSEKSFWAGYGSTLSECHAAHVRRGVYNLLNLLWNAYVYLREYNQPENARHEQIRAREQIAGLENWLTAEKE